MNALARLLQIQAFGKRIFTGGGFYEVKFRIDDTEMNRMGIISLKKKYPQELYVHFTTNGTVIFGGRFSTSGTFWEDSRWIMKRKNAVKHLNHG